MRFTSLIIELIRARPRLVVWIVVLFQAALWLILPLVLYRSPPGDLAMVLAYGREYQVGTDFGPPLAFWLADIAFRAAGNHMFGVYLLAQLCGVATLWALYLLARAVVGGQQAVLAVLLTMTVVAFGSSSGEFAHARMTAPCLRQPASRAFVARSAGWPPKQVPGPNSTTIHRRRGRRAPPHVSHRRVAPARRPRARCADRGWQAARRAATASAG